MKRYPTFFLFGLLFVFNASLAAAPALTEYAFEKNIILTFPTSLLAILKGFSMTIQKAEMTKNINEIQQMSIELYKRFLNFVEKFSEVGSNISKLNVRFWKFLKIVE